MILKLNPSKFIVNGSGRLRVIVELRKSMYAFVRGKFGGVSTVNNPGYAACIFPLVNKVNKL